MIRVIIAEDEPPILNAIANMIEQTNSHFHIVGKASDGEDALALIESLNPDVVFTDVKMPVMDGLSLIERLSSSHPEIITIILSGYKEFEYAQKALKFGVYDYLTKPLNLDVLKELLDKIVQTHTEFKKGRQQKILEQLMNNTLPTSDPSRCNEFLELFHFKKYVCLLICTGSYSTYHSSLLTPGSFHLTLYNMDDIIRKAFGTRDNYWILDGEHNNEKVVLLGIGTSPNPKLRSILHELYSQLSSCDIPLTMVVSESFDTIVQFAEQLHKLQKILKKNICFAMSQLIFENELSQMQHKSDYKAINASWESFFNDLIITRQKDAFKQNMRSLITLCEETRCRQFILEKALQQLLGFFCNVSESRLPDNLIDIHIETSELIADSTNYIALNEGLVYLIDDLFENYAGQTINTDNHEETIDRIEKYIQANYSKPITLQTLAETFGFAPQYLSRKYKKIKGLTPNDFITSVRIEKAKELLQVEPPVTIKNIALTVGYEDPFYLSRIFKLVTGKTPSEFRTINK